MVALRRIPGIDLDACRTPELRSDAAWLNPTSGAKTTTGTFFIDDTLLRERGVADFERYLCTPMATSPGLPPGFAEPQVAYSRRRGSNSSRPAADSVQVPGSGTSSA